jgi:hypothetical protein
MDAGVTLSVPQADDIVKILDLPLAIAQGANTKYLLTKHFGFDERQSDYYLEVGEMLGFVNREEGIYILTPDGKKYLRMDPPRQKLAVTRRMLAIPIVAHVVAELITSERKVLSKDEVESIIEERAGIHGTTVPRRAHTLMAWFEWMGEETGVFSVDGDTIKLAYSSMNGR